jgi:hypothetical protein
LHEVREFAGHADIRTTELYFVRKEEDGEVAAPLPGWFGEVIEVWEDGRLGELLYATRFQHTAEDAAAEAWRWIKDNT